MKTGGDGAVLGYLMAVLTGSGCPIIPWNGAQKRRVCSDFNIFMEFWADFT